MTTRILILATALLAARPVAAQVISVPSPDQARRPLAVSVTMGFLQGASRYDGQSDALWSMGEALQYRGSLEYGMRSGSVNAAITFADVPLARSGGTAPPNSDGTIQLQQFLATFRTPETEGPHQIIEIGGGLSRWANYSGTDVLTADEAKARNAFTLVVGYGFGFTIGDRASLLLVQDFSTLWGSADGIPAGVSRSVKHYTTRFGVRYRFRGGR